MFNPEYTYENIGLWEPETWASHFSPIRHLFRWIEAENHARRRVAPGDGPYAGRTGAFDAKTMSYFYPAYIDGWRERGLVFHSTEMGSVVWTAMLPTEVCEGRERAPRVLVVLSDADFSDPNWSIHVLTRHDAVTELAARERLAVLYITLDNLNVGDVPFSIMQEFSVIYNLRMDRVYLDVRALRDGGGRLAEIPGFAYPDAAGAADPDPDSRIELWGDLPVLDISHRWQNRYSGLMEINTDFVQHPAFDKAAFIHSRQGRAMADALRLEFDYDSAEDPAFLRHWADMGLDFASHDYDGYQWISCAPKGCLGQGAAAGQKLPAVLIFQEVTYQDPHQAVAAAAAYLGYLELAAEGELVALFFALESVEDNDRFYDIAVEAAELYPIDLTRLYVTGQSHNGYFADEFARRFHDKIAGVAPLSNHPGIPEPAWTTSPVPVPDEAIEAAAGYDMPTIVVTSIAESRNPALHCRQDDAEFSSAARAYQRRLRAQGCPVPGVAEINAVRHDPSALRTGIGYPVDEAWVEYHDGAPVYIGDVLNTAGKKHFRLALLTNQTHFIAPQMPALSWAFLKRFARDLETGACVELF